MAELVLTAETGRDLGTRPTRRLRREGKVPGVVYGLGTDPATISVDYGDLRAVLTSDAGLNALIELDLDGERLLCIVKDLQRDPVRHDVTHVDLIRIDVDVEVEVDVPILLVGDARKVTDESGMVDQAMFSLSIYSKPGAIPNEFTIDISEMEINDSIRVADVDLPSGVRTEVDPDEAVVLASVTRSTLETIAEEEAIEAEAVAVAEAEAGEAIEGEEPAEPGDASDD
ncbi:MAG: 50S ribosomal protein L25 [Acidimicrobiia bacterium]|nr:50S ribosomal protein L25 [Acidimicrobiia bacterium]